jgi:hypothetical protein
MDHSRHLNPSSKIISGVADGLQFTLHQGRRILDALNAADFTDNYSGKLEEAFRLGGGNGIPLPENKDRASDSRPGTSFMSRYPFTITM